MRPKYITHTQLAIAENAIALLTNEASSPALTSHGWIERGQVEEVEAGEQQESHLPEERDVRAVLLAGHGDDPHHPAHEVDTEAEHAPWQTSVQG